MKDSPIYLIQIPLSYVILTEQLVIVLTALSDFKSWNMNIALHILQLFLQNQLPCSLAISVLLDIVIHVLVTCLVFWDLLSDICRNKPALPSFPQKTSRICPCSQLRLLSWKTSQKKLHIEQYVLLLSNRIGKAAVFWWFWWWGHFVCLCWVSYFLLFFRQLESNSICKGSKILYVSLDNVPELLDFCSSLSIKFIEQAKDWARWGIGCDSSFQCQNKMTVSCSSPSWFDRC